MQPSVHSGPSAAPPVAPARPVLRPSGWWYAAAAAVGVVGVALALGVLVRGIVTMNDTIDDFDRVDVPGSLEVRIDEPGGYSIYHEVTYRPYYSGLWGLPEVTVTGPDGRPVRLDSYGTEMTYDVGGHNGRGLYSFHAAEAGTYRVEAFMGDSTSMRDERRGDNVVAVGPGVGESLVTAIVVAVAVALVACIAGVALAIVVGVRRGRSRRAQTPVPPVPGYGPPPGYGSPPGYGPPLASWGSAGPAVPPAWGPPPAAGAPPPPPGGAWGPVGPGPQDAPPADAPRDRDRD